MTHQCLNSLFLLYVHTARTESLNLTSVAKEFASTNSSRQENCNVRGRGIDLRTSQRFCAGNEYTAEDEPTFRLFSFRQTRRL